MSLSALKSAFVWNFVFLSILSLSKGEDIMFGREYRDLADLLLNNERAKHFYKSLPQDIQQILTENGSEIRTMTALRHFAKTAPKTDD